MHDSSMNNAYMMWDVSIKLSDDIVSVSGIHSWWFYCRDYRYQKIAACAKRYMPIVNYFCGKKTRKVCCRRIIHSTTAIDNTSLSPPSLLPCTSGFPFPVFRKQISRLINLFSFAPMLMLIRRTSLNFTQAIHCEQKNVKISNVVEISNAILQF